MIFNKILNKSIFILKKWNRHRFYKKEMNRLETKVEKFCKNNKITLLSTDEFAYIRNYWKPYINYEIKPFYYSMLSNFQYEYPIYQAVNEAIMFNCIVRKLNPIDASKILANKALYGILFHDINRPKEILKNSNGLLVDQNHQIISTKKGIDSLLSYNKPFIIKPTIDSHGGRNVKIIKDYNKDTLITLLNEYKQNYVIQSLVEQSTQTREFNPTSLNTFRIVTLFLNGKITVLSCILRCGGKDSIVDNATSGGMFIGINKETGQLTRASSYSKIEINESPTGLKFSNYKIENFDKIKELAIQLHTRIPYCAIAGWDIALDVNNQPTFIEVNLNKPSVWLMQICNGPIFGERFEEVIEYCFK